MASLKFQCYDGTGVSVDESIMRNAIKAALKAIEHELPEEARVHAVYNYVLEESKTAVDVTGKIRLD